MVYKGTLQIDGVKREDQGLYTCTARNTAGHVAVTSTLNVVTKPVIEEFKNITTQVLANTEIICRASGDPAPDIMFHKDSEYAPFETGTQHDPRIFVDVRKDERITTATLKITDVQRSDDGLYNCIAYNKRIKTELLGHITVEYPPTFANTPMYEAWSWDNRLVNVTCLAEGIPNATISWFIEGAIEKPVDIYTPNMRQIGFQSMSSLEIRPIDRWVFGFYKCIATNKLGVAEHRVHLREARKPGPILEAIVYEKTATSISYRIIGPLDDGGLPIKTFVAQYKDDR
ncbi:Fasciclin-2 [Orchesella cincta]|uniref:Fasciclin-2 n=1 Tax=Orchesella cincta TaxID=48709 RepID=A0A1D2MLQ9_ORCCI|nr:Fasciclin-2 [Orchesella cincta]